MQLATLLIVYISEFSDLDELCCSRSDGHVAASSLRCVSFGPFASSFAALLMILFILMVLGCSRIIILYNFLGPHWPHRGKILPFQCAYAMLIAALTSPR